MNREMAAALYLFQNTVLVYKDLGRYVDIDDGTIDFSAIKKRSEPWSDSEKILVDVAWDLFNGHGNANFSDMIFYLDDDNLRAVFQAVLIRRQLSFDFQEVK